MTTAMPIYLDYAATTPVDPRVVQKMLPYLAQCFGNPASRNHAYGMQALQAVEEARAEVSALVHCDPKEIVWTSGATESNNLALKGAANFYASKGRHILTVQTEHKSVLDTLLELEKQGYSVTRLAPEKKGLVDPHKFRAALRADTILASVMLVNNETGVLQDIAALGAVCMEQGVIFHVDAAQAAGKVEINLDQLPIDLMSFSAHKIYGPKGIGALYVRRKPRIQLQAQMHGGGHERGLRSGTLATHQIAGMGAAFRLARNEMELNNARIRKLREQLLHGLLAIGDVQLNGDPALCIPHILNVSFKGVVGELLLKALDGLAVSSGSACGSGSVAPSHVLRALGCSDELAHSAIRFSLGRQTTAQEIDACIRQVGNAVAALRERAQRVAV